MDKKEKREYLKPYRCLGGFMLFTGIFSALLNSALSSLNLVFYSIIPNEDVSNFLAETLAYGTIVYSYYVAYRIFIKKYVEKIIEITPIRKPLMCIVEMVITFILIRYAWYFWTIIIENMGWYEAAETETGMYLMGIIYAGLIAPIAEEMLFRGFLLKMLRRYSALVAIVFTSLSFGIFHGTLLQSVPAIFIGALLALIDLRHDSIIPSIILHIATNCLSIAQIWIPLQMPFSLQSNLIIAAVLLVLILILNIGKLKDQFKNIKTVFRLSYTSISYIVFLAGYIALIIIPLFL